MPYIIAGAVLVLGYFLGRKSTGAADGLAVPPLSLRADKPSETERANGV